MDSIRSQFFWRGDCAKFKYQMMKWENVYLPKDFGGLGVINTRVSNESILMKWVWRIYTGSEDDLCGRLLRQKYSKRKPLLNYKGSKGSQFLEGVNKIKNGFSWGRFLRLTMAKTSDSGKMSGKGTPPSPSYMTVAVHGEPQPGGRMHPPQPRG